MFVSPSDEVKTLGFCPRFFKHLSRDQANINAFKNKLEPIMKPQGNH